MKNKLRTSKGITLIALVITIIVLLILAGIAISMLSGDNGILNQATKAKEETEKGEVREKIRLSEQAARAENEGGITKASLKTELKKYFGENGFIIEDVTNEEGKLTEYKVTVGKVEEKITANKNKDYIKNGLLLYLDGIDNTRNGHNEDSTFWEDLSDNEKDVELRDFSYNEKSGWIKDGLRFDGVNDGVYLDDKIKDLLKDDFTIEIVLNCDKKENRDILIGNYDQPHTFNIEKYGNTDNSLRLYVTGYTTIDYHSKVSCSIQETMNICLILDKENDTIKFFKNAELKDTCVKPGFNTYNYDYTNVWLRNR